MEVLIALHAFPPAHLPEVSAEVRCRLTPEGRWSADVARPARPDVADVPLSEGTVRELLAALGIVEPAAPAG